MGKLKNVYIYEHVMKVDKIAITGFLIELS